MARHTSPYNQISVPVLDQNGKPISPTRPSRARRWMESGRAVKVWKHGYFAVQLTDVDADNCVTPEISVNTNPGDRTTGMAVMLNTPEGTAKVVGAYEIKHRGRTITQRMTARSSIRTNRRGRIRRRPAKFNNRTRKPDWLPPSMKSKLANIITTIKRLRDLFPVTELKLESYKFDPRLMQDPDVHGTGYQTSERGEMQVREYVLQRDGRNCQYRQKCKGGKRKNKSLRLELDHIVPKSAGGPYRVSNLITSCKSCNKAKSNKRIEEFLANDPDRLRKIRAQLKRPLASATHMNQLMPLLVKALETFGLPLLQTDAVTTAYTRKVLEIEKTHANDAACLGEPAQVMNIPETVHTLESVGHGRRQMLWPPNKYGTPRYKAGPQGRTSPYRAYSRLSRSQQGHTTMPGHRLRQRRNRGITSGDLIRYHHPKDGLVTGYAIFINGNTRVCIKGNRSVKTEFATLLARANGYRHGREPNVTPERWKGHQTVNAVTQTE